MLCLFVVRASWSVGDSSGVVTFPTPPASLEAATAAADQLMYEIKRLGKDRWVHRLAKEPTDSFSSSREGSRPTA